MGLGQQTGVGIMSVSEGIAALRAEKETIRRETDVLKAELEEAKRQLKRSKSETMNKPMLPRLERPQQLAPTAAPAVEVRSDTSVFPAASSKAVAEAPTSSAGAASTSVPAAAPATGGTVFPTTSVGGTARAPASDNGTVALTAASATGGTVPSAASVGGAPASSAVEAASVESAAEPAISGTVPSAASVKGEVGRRESFAGAVPSNAAAEAAPSTGDTAAPVESAAWEARKPASATGSAGDRWVANICGESGASTHPFDPGTVFPPEVRYSTHGNISSSNSRGNSSNDTTSNHDSWWEATYVGALLRPFDPGKGCQRDARIEVILGLDLPFDRGKA